MSETTTSAYTNNLILKDEKFYYRITKEIEQLKKFNDDKTSLITIDKIFEEINTINVIIQSTPEKCYNLMIKLDENHPYKAPIVKVLNDFPVNEHIDLDGNICFNEKNWSLAVSIVGLIYNIMAFI
jgi:ubiquitin-protein ligase